MAQLERYLTEQQMQNFLQESRMTRNQERDYCLMLVMYRHGLRVSELINLRLKDIDLQAKTIKISRSKHSRSNVQYLTADEIRALKAYLPIRSHSVYADQPVLFLGERGGLQRQAINYLCRVIGEKANLSVHPHMLRHSTGYALTNKGIDLRKVQEALGHRSIQSTIRYTALAPSWSKGLWD